MKSYDKGWKNRPMPSVIVIGVMSVIAVIYGSIILAGASELNADQGVTSGYVIVGFGLLGMALSLFGLLKR